MHTGFTYQQGQVEDLEPLLSLGIVAYSEYRQVLDPQHWPTLEEGLHDRDVLQELMSMSYIITCRNVAGTLAGAAYFIPRGNPTPVFDKDWCCIRRLAVDPAYRGHGIARTLTEQCIARARHTGEHTIALHTSEFMHTARNMYERMGFVRQRPIPDIFGKKYWLYTLSLLHREQTETSF